MSTPPTMNIIGCGKLGMTLGRLWTTHQVFAIQAIMNRSQASTEKAIAFMQAGVAASDIRNMPPADAWLIATPDDDIASSCDALAASGKLKQGDIVFHCSGALPSSILAAATRAGAAISSVHPIRSFADPAQVAASFGGTFCGIEGDAEALNVLQAAFGAIGARTIPIDANFKTLYHAAAVFASNYLVTVLDVAVQAYVKAGIPEEAALQLMEPLVRGTVDNVFRLGTTKALTGPIARGDIATAVKQYRAVNTWDERHGVLYKQLGKLTSDIAARRRQKT
ncbi:Rossmann-like and DUF2520 domain-containing protein [Noviherbaspirillum saxi]|uniref:DUF2520 domain-containing protein n=1 Tax=Noviherbaspirillum saxi TaxID=2320863 RepID=A0A3A3FIQ8_9BURK|nr:Rossmann-like and DUF2520 domain-containing protein [Noviherbaspirillum saxi]RJF95378.1 DUF2520 domain-containing protein [Noviherbaspirillum saxi]